MRFDELDRRMRAFETEIRLPPGGFLVVRLDGRGFTRLSKRLLRLEQPFDPGFRDRLLTVAERRMTCGLKTRFGYCQSDEISILLDPAEDAFGRRAVKLASVFAGEASAALTLALGQAVAFDGRVIALPDEEALIDYFRWRGEDARRNALHAHCYWALRKTRKSGRSAERSTSGVTTNEKPALLAELGIDASALPTWQVRGVGLRWVEEHRVGHNPLTGEDVPVVRRRLEHELDLPSGEGLETYLRGLLDDDRHGGRATVVSPKAVKMTEE